MNEQSNPLGRRDLIAGLGIAALVEGAGIAVVVVRLLRVGRPPNERRRTVSSQPQSRSSQ